MTGNTGSAISSVVGGTAAEPLSTLMQLSQHTGKTPFMHGSCLPGLVRASRDKVTA